MLWDKYDLLILDLDGVVYIGDSAVPYAVESINQLANSTKICAATNNASRTPLAVAEHLQKLGLQISETEVFTSAQAAASLLSDLIPIGSAVLAIGGAGVEVALTEAGFEVVRASVDHTENMYRANSVTAVVQGHGTENSWWDYATALSAINAGKIWIATNQDSTVPIPGGFGPGNGSFAKLLQDLSGVKPIYAGKPENELFLRAQVKFKAENPLVIGDRFDTDINAAINCGFDSLLVETGVNRLAEASTNLPTYAASDLRALLSETGEEFLVRRSE